MEIGQIMLRSVSLKPIVGYSCSKGSVASGSENSEILLSHIGALSYLCSFRMFNNEDVTIGSWMLAMNVNHENTHALCEPECTPSSIAVWDIPKCSG